jgi:hypothetical protein
MQWWSVAEPFPVIPCAQHPYTDNMDVNYTVSIPGATSYTVTFDTQSATEPTHDWIDIYKSVLWWFAMAVHYLLWHRCFLWSLVQSFHGLPTVIVLLTSAPPNFVWSLSDTSRGTQFGTRYHGGRGVSSKIFAGVDSTPALVIPAPSFIVVFHRWRAVAFYALLCDCEPFLHADCVSRDW